MKVNLWIALTLSTILLTASCSRAPVHKPGKKQTPHGPKSSFRKDSMLTGFLHKKIPRTGTFTTNTVENVTTETYRREDGESIFVLENGELRTETEKRKSGLSFTRTWQAGVLTSMMVSGSKRTTLVYFDKEGNFLNKIVTTVGKENPSCYRYEGKEALLLEDSDCLELIPEFE